MLRILPRWNGVISSSPNGGGRDADNMDLRVEPYDKLARVQVQPPRNPNKPFTSFCIKDILGANGTTNNHRNRNVASPTAPRIVRPWDTSSSPGKDSENSSDIEEEINVEDDIPTQSDNKDVSPLDALMEMANKTFQGLETSEAADARRREQAAMFGKHQPPKKRRKSRTAFTNQQIYELEKRFLYQKYLTPADRDEIAQTLGLTNAQVITWFQNRRAKLKRDLEELKNDVTATKKLSSASSSVYSGGEDDPLGFSENECDVITPPKQCKTPTSESGEDRCQSPQKTESSESKSPEET